MGWGEEYDSACNLVDSAMGELKKLDPKHELLKYLSGRDIDPKTSKADTEKEKLNLQAFYNRFWKKDEPWQNEPGIIRETTCMANYWVEIEKAIRVINGIPEVVTVEKEPQVWKRPPPDDLPF